MHLIGQIIFGLIVGLIAKLLMPGRDPGGFIITMLLGIAGAFAAKYLGQVAGLYQPGQSAGLLGSTVGAILILIVYRLVKKKSTP